MNDEYFSEFWKKVDKLTPVQKTTLISAMYGTLEAKGFDKAGFERLLRQVTTPPEEW